MGNEESEVVLDLSGRKLKKLERAPLNQRYATALLLDNNQIQNLGNLDSYGELERLSIADNELIRMHWFGRMYSIRILNLPNNNIVQMEGLRELHHLLHLNLSGNHIKTIDGLSNSYKLEHLNLAGNKITHVNDISVLKNLKELFLHRNQIESLHHCTKFLPHSLLILTLSDNFVADLNELNVLSHLAKLEQFTVLNNPCLDSLHIVDNNAESSGQAYQFDYRPFVINWCLNLRVLDGYKITPKESLKGEWLYSQGKGRCFQLGEHDNLVQYMSTICPVGGGWGGADLPDDEAKLAKVLELVKQHQHDVRSKAVSDNDKSESPKTPRMQRNMSSAIIIRKNFNRSLPTRCASARHHAPKSARDVHRRAKSYSSYGISSTLTQSVHENVQSSYNVELASTLYGTELRTPETPNLMTQSMDPALLSQLAESDRAQNDMSTSLGSVQMSRSLCDQATASPARDKNCTTQSNKLPIDLMKQTSEQVQDSSVVHNELDYEVNQQEYNGGFCGNKGKVFSRESSLEGTPTLHQMNQWSSSILRPSSADRRQRRTTKNEVVCSSPQRPRSSSLKSPDSCNVNRASIASDMSQKMGNSLKRTVHTGDAPPICQPAAERADYSSLNKISNRQYCEDSIQKQYYGQKHTKAIPPTHSVSTRKTENAAIIIQRYWRGFSARQNNAKVRAIREHMRHSRAEQHIRFLSEKLRRTEVALEKEKRLRRLQLDAIRTLWREIQKMQTRKDGVTTPSTPMTPLTPITPLEKNEKTSNRTQKIYSEESVSELTEFCKSLEGQVKKLESSLSYVNQITSYLCHLPGAQQLLANLPDANSVLLLQPGTNQDGGSIEDFTNSIEAMTTLLSKGGKITEGNFANRHQTDDVSDTNHSGANCPTRPSSLPVKRQPRDS